MSNPRDFGFLVLESPADAKVDVIFIHGLDGHRVESCTINGKMWLRDFLPSELPEARIMTYGYDGYTSERNLFSTQTLKGHATDFLAKLGNRRFANDARPIIFIGHNVGGIILKSALIIAKSCHQGHLPNYRKIYDSTKGVVFLGTPHQGTPYNYLQVALDENPRNNTVARHIKENTEWLQRQLAEYLPINANKNIQTMYFYENLGTLTAAGMQPVTLVSKAAAGPAGDANAGSAGMARNHHMLTKFAASDDDYFTLTDTLQSMAGVQREFRHIAEMKPELQVLEEQLT